MKFPYFLQSCFCMLSFTGLSSCWLASYWDDCQFCPPEEILRSDAYGIDFTLDHIAVAVERVNGTREPVMRIEATPEYRSMMFRYANESVTGLDCSNSRKEDPSIATQFPEADGQILSTQIDILLQKMGGSANAAMKFVRPTYPAFIDCQQGFIFNDILKRAGLMSINGLNHEITAIHTFNPKAFCLRSEKVHGCDPDELYGKVLILDYSQSMLSVSVLAVSEREFLTGSQVPFVDLKLGADPRNYDHFDFGELEYWGLVMDAIRNVIIEGMYTRYTPTNTHDTYEPYTYGFSNHPYTQFILLGDSATSPKFHDEITRAVALAEHDLQQKVMNHADLKKDLKQSLIDPNFAAAIGAAMETKSAIDSSFPWGCRRETSECSALKDKVWLDSLTDSAEYMQQLGLGDAENAISESRTEYPAPYDDYNDAFYDHLDQPKPKFPMSKTSSKGAGAT